MDSHVATNFINKFDPSDQKHVVWFKMVNDFITAEKKDFSLAYMMKKNPMGLDFTEQDAMEIMFIQFGIGLSYSKAVLEKRAWIPSRPM